MLRMKVSGKAGGRVARRGPGGSRKARQGGGSSVEHSIGRRLRLHRLQAHLSMRELARRAGIAVSYLCNLEAGRLSASLAMLRKVLVALGTDLEPFFGNGHPVVAGAGRAGGGAAPRAPAVRSRSSAAPGAGV